jgi:hypothetical protein
MYEWNTTCYLANDKSNKFYNWIINSIKFEYFCYFQFDYISSRK